MADGTYPAKFNFNLPGQTPTCSDFVVYGLNTAGSSTQANLIGLTNLYSGGSASTSGLCNSNTGVYQLYEPSYTWAYAPTLKFAYNGSTISGAITNSLTMSEDGLKVAYVESNSSTTKSALHVVTIPSGSDGGVCYSIASDGTKQTSCGAVATTPSLIKTVPSTGSWSSTDSFSSVWVDYTNDLAYVGTDNGILHKIQNVFCTNTACTATYVAPSEVTTGGWPITLTGSGALTSPVQGPDGTIYVAGATSGKLYAVTTAGVVTTSAQGFMASSIVDGPILDVDSSGTTQELYWFSNSQSATSSPSVRQPQVVQTDSKLANFTNIPLLVNGTATWPTDSTAIINVHAGTFDNAFYNGRVGNLWTCGWWQNGANSGNHQGVVRIGLSGSSVAEDTSKIYAETSPDWVAANVNTCAPLAEALDSASVDHIFVSTRTGYSTSVGTCVSNQSCLYGYSLSSTGSPATYSLTTTGSYSLANAGNNQGLGVSSTYSTGMIVDNNVDPTATTCGTNKNQTCAQAASIYFMYGTNAVKLTQAQLQ
jgi:hypothetical protein